MNAVTVLMTPWRASSTAMRWVVPATFLIFVAVAVAVAAFSLEPGWWLISTMTYAMGIAAVSTFWLSPCVLLAIDAHRLRLPAMGRAAGCSVLLFGGVLASLPTLMMSMSHAPLLLVEILSACAVLGALAFSYLPSYLAMVIGFLPAIFGGLRGMLGLGVWTRHSLLVVSSVTLGLLLVAVVIRWRQLIERDPGEGKQRALVLQFRHVVAGGNWNGSRGDGNRLIRQRPNWMQPEVDLRKVGPGFPVAALRVLLGGPYLPQTWRSHTRQLVFGLGQLLLFIPLMAFLQAGEAHGDVLRKIIAGAGINIIGWVGVMVGLILPSMTLVTLQQRWSRASGELALLALTPGLQAQEHSYRNLLRATLTKPLTMSATILALVCGTALVMQLGATVVGFVAVGQFACMLASVAFTLNILSGKALPRWLSVVLFTALFVLVATGSFVPLFNSPLFRHPATWAYLGVAEYTLAAGYVVFLATMVWITHRARHRLLGQPHPFLPSR